MSSTPDTPSAARTGDTTTPAPTPHIRLSVVVPMLNEERAIGSTLEAVRAAAPDAEIIVVDGGSADHSVAAVRNRCDLLLSSPRGRARQMNTGAAAARGDALVFVHADTIVPSSFAHNIDAALANSATVGGRFDLVLDDPTLLYRILGRLISIRSRWMRSATGDQAIFVRRETFQRMLGFADIELCEDVDFARRLRRYGRVACLRSTVTTSARRWRKDGLLRTVLRMWLVKALFLLGVPPHWLKRHYADTR